MTSVQIANNLQLKVPSGTAPAVECSLVLDATGASQAAVSGAVSIESGAVTLMIILQGSNDQSTWFPLGASNGQASAVGPMSHTAPISGYAFVRVRWEATSSTANDYMTISATLNLGL